MVNRVGRFTLFRYTDGSRSLRLRELGYPMFAPKLPGWECFFVGRHPDHTSWSYRKVRA